MLYLIFGEDLPDSLERRLAVRPAHLARLNALKAEGRLVLAGPCPAIDSPDPGPAGFTGSLIVAEFPSFADARAWADADPYIAAGVIDDSAQPAGHAGARDGGGHYRVHIVSERFAGLATMARHRLVYDALGTLMNGAIHALSITARTPAE